MVDLLNIMNNDSYTFFFLLFIGSMFLSTALVMILTESAVHTIMYLMYLFIYLTELTIVLRMEFIALIFIIVYIGAVCILMLFHIKLIKIFLHKFDDVNYKELYLPFVLISIFLPLIQVLTLIFEGEEITSFDKNLKIMNPFFEITNHKFISYNYTSWIDLFDTFRSTQMLGFFIYNVYPIYIFLGSLILLVAMIGSIILTMSESKEKVFQKLHKQVFVSIVKRSDFYK